MRTIMCKFSFTPKDLDTITLSCMDEAEVELMEVSLYAQTPQDEDQMLDTDGKIAKYFEDNSISTCDLSGQDDWIHEFNLVDLDEKTISEGIAIIQTAWKYFKDNNFFS